MIIIYTVIKTRLITK